LNRKELNFIKKHRAIYLVGGRGSGKTSLARYLKSKFDCDILDVVSLDKYYVAVEQTKPMVITSTRLYDFDALYYGGFGACIIFTSIFGDESMAHFLKARINKSLAKAFQRRFVKSKGKNRPCLVVSKEDKPFISTYSYLQSSMLDTRITYEDLKS
jgi:hypothetical protein